MIDATGSGADAVLARAAQMGGPHHLSRLRTAPASLFDLVEALANVLASIEARLATRDGLEVAPDRRGQVYFFAMGMHLEIPARVLDLGARRPWMILGVLIASATAAESRLAEARGEAGRDDDAPDILAELAEELAAGGPDLPDPVRYEAAVGDLVARSLAIDAGLDRP